MIATENVQIRTQEQHLRAINHDQYEYAAQGRLSLQANEPSNPFVTLDPAFSELIGHNATMRRLIKIDSGTPLFHEAGVYCPQSGHVFVSSNRIPTKSSGGRQEILVTRLDVRQLTPPRSSHASGPALLPDLEASSSSAAHAFKSSMITLTPTQCRVAMANGATNWQEDGQEAVLWCDQGVHDLDGQGVPEVPSALVSYVVDKQTGLPTSTKTLLTDFDGLPFSSLNDVVVHKQSGCVFFTDPDYGVGQSFKRSWEKEKYAPNALYVWNPATGEVNMLDDRYYKPNGVTFVPDPEQPETGKGWLVTTDTGRFSFDTDDGMGIFKVDADKPACLYTYAIQPSEGSKTSRLPQIDAAGRRLLGHSDCPVPDGIHPDTRGNVWSGNGDGVHVWSPRDRKCLGKILVPGGKGVANFCWAGPVDEAKERWRLLLFCEDELWEVCVAVNGFD